MKENKNEITKYAEVTSITLSYEEKVKIANSSEVHKILTRILDRENMLEKFKEHFWVLGLDNEDYLLSVNTVSLGDIESVFDHPMNTFGHLILQGARYCILAHNHTSQSLTPSKEDIRSTCRLYNCGRILKIPVKDHVIISGNTYLSFEETGYMEKVRRDTRYLPNHMVEERIKEEVAIEVEKYKKNAAIETEKYKKEAAIEAGKTIKDVSEQIAKKAEETIEQARKKIRDEVLSEGKTQGKLETAKNMKALGIDINLIMQSTGLDKNDIEKI